MKRLLHTVLTAVLICSALLTHACKNKSESGDQSADSLSSRLHDTIVVGTLYSPTSYFLYKGDLMGYHYDLISKFAKDKGLAVEFKVTRNMASLIELLDSAKIDVIAYSIPVTAEYKELLRHCGSEIITHQVLVQPENKGDMLITDVTQLVGRTIYVEQGSKYESRLHNLNNELGGGINIKTIKHDSIMTEDLIEMVANGKIPLTVTDSDIAKLDHTYYDNIDIDLEISFPQKSSWAVNPSDTLLANAITAWAKTDSIQQLERQLFRQYFEKSKINRGKVLDFKHLAKGHISEYDEFFKKYAANIGWDWRLLAAQAYIESRFDPYATSWAGARGLLQMMPATARRYGLSMNDITDPELNIAAATRSIADLDKSLKKYVSNDKERINFILAAYNSGIAHIYDAIALAGKYGKNPTVWHGNVSEALLLKANPDYYNDEVCKFGYFRGKQTVAYVEEVTRIYDIFKQQ